MALRADRPPDEKPHDQESCPAGHPAEGHIAKDFNPSRRVDMAPRLVGVQHPCGTQHDAQFGTYSESNTV